MNNKFGIIATACGILASSCADNQDPLKEQHDKITHEIENTLNEKPAYNKKNTTANFEDFCKIDTSEYEHIYDNLIQKISEPIIRGDMTKPEFSLTFDDGYGSENINKILDILQENNIQSTFFILGDCLKQNPELRRKAIDQGHQICNHTYSYHYFKATDTTLLEKEIIQREETAKDVLGEEYLRKMKSEFPFFRFPGGCGALDTNNINILKKHGYVPIARSDDNRRFGDKIRNGEIILMHFKESDIERLGTCILEAGEQGMTPKSISETVSPEEVPTGWKNLQEKKKEATEFRLKQFENGEISEEDLLDHTP